MITSSGWNSKEAVKTIETEKCQCLYLHIYILCLLDQMILKERYRRLKKHLLLPQQKLMNLIVMLSFNFVFLNMSLKKHLLLPQQKLMHLVIMLSFNFECFYHVLEETFATFSSVFIVRFPFNVFFASIFANIYLQTFSFNFFANIFECFYRAFSV